MIRKLLLSACLLALAGCSTMRSLHLAPDRAADRAPVYIVFFHYDAAVLTPDARRIVDAAAASVRDTKPAVVELAGYAETSAMPGARHLADPRFNAVTDALIADGVDPRLLARVPLTDSEASLPATADRRVEIRLLEKARP
jgi:outer membrane protein OmpA-like peptidoglycan-associated protein